MRRVLLLVLVSACADDFVAVRGEETPVVVQNIAYNTTNVFEAPVASATTTPTPTLEASHGVAVLPPPHDKRVVVSSGVLVCDRYLARAETCSVRVLSSTGGDSAIERITSSLDYTRRAWHRAVEQGGAPMRANLEASCTDMLKQYESSAGAWCPN